VKRRLTVHGLDFAVIDEGSGPAVLLLHGFPDSSYLWRHQIPVLVEAGFRVIAPDLRGFGESAKPPRVEDYRLTKIMSDVVGIMTELGIPRAHIVGHDWGASVAWLLGALTPRRVDHLTVISVGHPKVYHRTSLAQREKSWYMLFYQFEGIAEELIQRHNFRGFREFQGDEGDVDRYIEDLSRPGALTAALNWYRANRHPATELGPPPRVPPVPVPTMAVWSTGDRAMLEEGILDSKQYVSGPWRYERIDGANHWIPVDAPAEFNKLLLSFLGSEETESRPRQRRTF
jgi:pimeloyl-ACP methyl ester carboxylesterase